MLRLDQNGDVGVPFRAALFDSYTIRFFLVYDLIPADRQAAITGLQALLEAGKLHHAVAARFPLADIVSAHEAVERGRIIGNVVVDLDVEGG